VNLVHARLAHMRKNIGLGFVGTRVVHIADTELVVLVIVPWRIIAKGLVNLLVLMDAQLEADVIIIVSIIVHLDADLFVKVGVVGRKKNQSIGDQFFFKFLIKKPFLLS